ncbi:MAG: DNA alkylation repair protein [Muribaculaceae bacterium]|nr:DNA alkylation repair protein [Muribaculaceae bacterium]
METQFNSMQAVKRRFFAMRNGVIADTLRRAGSPFHIIFGLNLPQISEIAAEWHGHPEAGDLARKLWANTTCRESMLLAPMLMHDATGVDKDEARRMIAECPAAEVTDVLCHRLLRHSPYAAELAGELCADEDEKIRYAGLRLMFNIVASHPHEAKAAARAELTRNCAYTDRIAAALLDEAEYRLS